MSSLPVIDLGESDRAYLARRVVDVLGSLGFLMLENIAGFEEDDLKWCVKFFFEDMPQEKKMQVARHLYNPKSEKFYRGYFGTNKVGSSFKEGYEVGIDYPEDDPDFESGQPFMECSSWPEASEDEDEEPYKKFKNIMMRYHSIFMDISMELIKLVAIGLGLNEHYFVSLFTKSVSTLRIINYPVHNFKIPADAYSSDNKLISTAEHIDTSILTLLTTFDYEGLQVKKEDGTWLDVVPCRNGIVVNVGSIFEKMTNGGVKATIHRVLAIGRSRQSVPFFFEPSSLALLPNQLPKDLGLKSAADYPQDDTFEYREFIITYLERFIEWRGFYKGKDKLKDTE